MPQPDHSPQRRNFLLSTTGLTAGLLAMNQTHNAQADINSAQVLQANSPDQLAELNAQGFRANPYRAGRSMTISKHGIVATSHTLASQAGLDMIRAGGSAMDAAVAAAAVLNVVEPMSTGMGGDAFFQYYDAESGKLYGLNGSGHSPKQLTREHFDRTNQTSVNAHTWEAVIVPGAVDAWFAGHQRFGKLPWATVLEPAVRYAEEGFGVTEIVGAVWATEAPNLLDHNDPFMRSTYLVNDHAPAIGSLFRNPRLAASLRAVAEGGRDAFYEGPIAREIVRYAQETGGFFTLDDFESNEATWVEPLSVNYRGYDVYQLPPNGQGLGVLLMLNLLKGFDMGSMPHNSTEYLHLSIEAKKLAYADLKKYVADPDFAQIPLDDLLSDGYADERRKLIREDRAAEAVEFGLPEGRDTVYLAASDPAGNACSFINSVSWLFGSRKVGGETGIIMQNRGGNFTLERGHANEYAPGKRSYHTIIPGMVMKDGGLYMAFGLMGGPMQPQGHAQFVCSHVDHGLNIQEANDVPRWRHDDGLKIRLEYGMGGDAVRGLERLGHVVNIEGGHEFGGAQTVLWDKANGLWRGGSDPRKDGAALGW